MSGFSGLIGHQIDGKNRIRIPNKFRAEIVDELTLMFGDQKCVFVYPRTPLEEKFDSLEKIHIRDVEAMRGLRKLRGGTFFVQEDDQGRILLAAELREHIGITEKNRELVTVGMGDHLEIWLKSEYEEYVSKMSFFDAFSVVGF